MHEGGQGTRGRKNEDCPACRLLTIFFSNSFNKYSLNAYYYYLLGAILGAWDASMNKANIVAFRGTYHLVKKNNLHNNSYIDLRG